MPVLRRRSISVFKDANGMEKVPLFRQNVFPKVLACSIPFLVLTDTAALPVCRPISDMHVYNVVGDNVIIDHETQFSRQTHEKGLLLFKSLL
jgi:hypothetical protein